MSLEVKKNKRKFNSVCYLAPKLKSMWFASVRESTKKGISKLQVITRLQVITYVTVPIVMGFKENKTCSGGKKGGVAKTYSSESAMK